MNNTDNQTLNELVQIVMHLKKQVAYLEHQTNFAQDKLQQHKNFHEENRTQEESLYEDDSF